MSDNQRFSRTERHEKRKRNKRKVLFFGSLAAVFFIVLFSLIVFGGSDSSNDTASNDSTENETNVEEQEENDTPNDTETESTEDKQDDDSEDPVNQTDVEDRVEKENDDNNDDVDVEEVASDDSNVIQAYEGDWDPVGTNQQGEHTTNYETDSEDRQEIKKAVSQVTEVPEDNIIEHWVGNNGDQKVVATIQDESTAEYYRVYLQWEDDKGWKPTKYEEIKSNDAN